MKKISKDPRMHDSFVEVEGIKLHVDPINRARSENSDNVMAIFWEEQPFTWRFSQPYVGQALAKSSGSVDFLDVGTGSGIFGILMAKHNHSRVIAVDKSRRAIEFARRNAQLNGMKLDLRNESYNLGSVPINSVKIIGLYPPYHLYPEAIANKIPQHARGGSDGQGELRNQLRIASKHIAKDGVIFFNQMAWGDKNGPDFVRYVPEIFGKGVSLDYTNILPPMQTGDFLRQVYEVRHQKYQAQSSEQHPRLYYCVGIVKNDGKGLVRAVKHDIDLKGRSWKDRILLHREIAEHEFK